MKRRAHRVGLASMVGLIVTFGVAVSASAAPADAKLTAPTVTPLTGTTSTVFMFSVHFIGSASDPAISVSASVPGSSLALSLASGDLRNGTWTGSRTLSAGSWPVTFGSVSSKGTNPSAAGPTLVVSGPTATPAPTPPPTATPKPTATARPTPRPTPPATDTPAPGSSATPVALPTPFGTTVIDPSGSPSEPGSQSTRPSGSGSTSPSPAATPPGSRPFNVPVEGVVAIALLGAVTVAAALGERRRRRQVEAFRAAQASLDRGAPRGAGLESVWGRDTVEDETVTTIDYEGLDDPPDDG